jgi:CrcB protein
MSAKMVGAMAVGGGIGATARYQLGLHLAPPTPPEFPWATFWINMAGAFALGAVMTLLATAWLETRYVKPFVATGIIGSFTTWSHFIVEVDQLIGADEIRRAIVYAAASIGLGIVAASAGAAIVESWLRDRQLRKR